VPPGGPSRPVGTSFVVTVGAVAHGGHCVARHEGRVVFVRHALPGEVVRVVVTEGAPGSSYWRADAIEVVQAAPGRVAPPCPWAGPGRCGGCDWQHADLATQRELKTAVVREQLARLAGLDCDVVVEAVPGDDEGLGWRTSVTYAVSPSGRAGLRRHRSHEVVAIDECRIAHPLVRELPLTGNRWPPDSAVEVAVSPATGECLVLVDGRPQPLAGSTEGGAAAVHEVAAGHRFRVSRGGFWQVHPGAADALSGAVLDALQPRPGDVALDLYAGAGLFSAALLDRVSPGGHVVLVEGDPVAVGDARHNLGGRAGVRIERGRVDHVLRRAHLRRADLVVLDPPRSGAGKTVVDQLGRLHPRRIAYVACDPAALARDLRWLADRAGYRLVGLRAFDLFPMTHHVECVATLEPK
jgi:tRNA/tmRNA/rRNA uracil-C5-methylase (TrmA/RlmC/RlmD family)